MKIFEKFAWSILAIAAIYFGGHILNSLRYVVIETTAFWMIIRFIVGTFIGSVLGMLIIGNNVSAWGMQNDH